ncbi:hypothetical protein P0Y35_11670 [Kiritimatiellaeota bacterium B1221]|nr:hypothetical protein [Kiritimatiellaeota bacterium B1221]
MTKHEDNFLKLVKVNRKAVTYTINEAIVDRFNEVSKKKGFNKSKVITLLLEEFLEKVE